MNPKNIACLLVAGGSLSADHLRALHVTACKMAREEKTRLTFAEECGAGEVLTSFTPAILGVIGGIRFDGKIETDTGHTIKVSFIVRHFDIEAAMHASWSGPYHSWLELMQDLRTEDRPMVN